VHFQRRSAPRSGSVLHAYLHDIIATFAPRPFLACAAIHDRDFDVTGVRESIVAARPIFRLLDRPKHLQAVYPDSPHDFPPATRKQAYEFLDRHLKS
ncbi:MAG: hypothetical protein ACKVHE_34080, partial [Planctomycetales bacterium]